MTEWPPWALCAVLAFACAYALGCLTLTKGELIAEKLGANRLSDAIERCETLLHDRTEEWRTERAGLIARLEALHDRLMATDWPSYWQARAQDRMIESEARSRQGEHADAGPVAPFDAVDPIGRPVTGVRREQVDGYDE